MCRRTDARRAVVDDAVLGVGRRRADMEGVGSERADRAGLGEDRIVQPDQVVHDGKVGDGIDIGGGIQGRVEQELVATGAAGERVVPGQALELIVPAEPAEAH